MPKTPSTLSAAILECELTTLREWLLRVLHFVITGRTRRLHTSAPLHVLGTLKAGSKDAEQENMIGTTPSITILTPLGSAHTKEHVNNHNNARQTWPTFKASREFPDLVGNIGRSAVFEVHRPALDLAQRMFLERVWNRGRKKILTVAHREWSSLVLMSIPRANAVKQNRAVPELKCG